MIKKTGLLLTAFFTVLTSFAQEVVKIQASVQNRNGDVLYVKDFKNNTISEMKSDDKGNFSGSFAAEESFYVLFDGTEYAQLYLKNGYDLKVSLDASKFDATIRFTGNGSDVNNFLADYMLREQKFDYEAVLASPDMAAFEKVVAQKKTDDFAFLDKAKLDSKFVETMKENIEASMNSLKMYYQQSQKNKKLNNTKAPGFEYVNHAGGKTKLDDLKGKYVYIDVWATWCGPCRAEIPSLKAVEEHFHGKNIAFVSISVDVDKDFEKWNKFVTDKQLGGIQLFADKNWNSDFIQAFGIDSIPRFILIAPDGAVIDADAKRPSNPQLTQQLEELLK